MEREQIDLNIAELETRLDRLRALYEHYFMGIERIEPSVARKDVERRVAELRKARFQSTAQRFKFQTIVQRYNTMQQHWSRICREIELGTFRRHRLKAEQTYASRPPTPRASPAPPPSDADAPFRPPAESFVDFPPVEIGTGTASVPEQVALAEATELASAPSGKVLHRLRDSGSNSLTRGLLGTVPPDLAARAGGKLTSLASPAVTPLAARPGPSDASANPGPSTAKAKEPAPAAKAKEAAPAAPPPKPKDAPAASPANDRLPEDRVRALHQAYIDARKQTNASPVSFEKLERSLRETESKLRGTHKGRTVDFDVVIKDGKAILKPKLT